MSAHSLRPWAAQQTTFTVGDEVIAARRILFGTGRVVDVGAIGRVTKVPGDEDGTLCEVSIDGVLFDAAPGAVVHATARSRSPLFDGQDSPPGVLPVAGLNDSIARRPAPAQPRPLEAQPAGRGYWAVVGQRGCVVREQEALDSALVRNLAKGTVVRVAELRGRRALIAAPCRGWASLQSRGATPQSRGRWILAPLPQRTGLAPGEDGVARAPPDAWGQKAPLLPEPGDGAGGADAVGAPPAGDTPAGS